MKTHKRMMRGPLNRGHLKIPMMSGFWRVSLEQILNSKGWNPQAHREFPGKLDSEILSLRDRANWPYARFWGLGRLLYSQLTANFFDYISNIHIYIYIYTHIIRTCVYIYIYIFRERERDVHIICMCVYIYIYNVYIYIYIYTYIRFGYFPIETLGQS